MLLPSSPVLRTVLAAVLLGLTASHAADRVIACVGNSITFGYGLAWKESYPDRLDSLLGTGFSVSNFGVSGKTMVRGSNDTYWTQSAFANALKSQPSDIVIELGTNDSKTWIWPTYGKDFKADYRAMIDTFRTLQPQPEVWITLQPWANNADWNILDTTIAHRVNPLIRAVALEAGAHLIDLRTAFDGRKAWYLDDSVHPNAVGAQALAATVRDHLLATPVVITNAGGTLTATQGFGYAWSRNDTLLVADTTHQLVVTKPGSYKVSVKLQPNSESRRVSPALTVATTGATSRPPRDLRLRLTSNGVVVEGSEAMTTPRLTLRNAKGERVAPVHLAPGLYTYDLSGPGLERRGTLVIP
jgi:lysophospholipase L1-like esterase